MCMKNNRVELFNYVKEHTQNMEIKLIDDSFIDIKIGDFGICLELTFYPILTEKNKRQYLETVLNEIAYALYFKKD